MELRSVRLHFLFYFITFVYSEDGNDNDVQNQLMTTKVELLEPLNFVYWPNGTIPFYINNEHFDNEQTTIIMTSLSLVAFKTCLKFSPVMVPPMENQHVLTFVNPTGVKKCDLLQAGHSMSEPHIVNLGYDCLVAPWMDRVVLRALGLPFEHNRGNRDAYIDVQYENIEQNVIPLYTKNFKLPAALRALPYDVNSVLHFGDRDFSKNGHRTIIFKNPDMKQKWEGLSELDLRKIEIIYGPECRERDRQEKVELCHLYPGIAPVNRRKRSINLETTRSLRVNPDITPPPDLNNDLNVSEEVRATLKSLDIEAEVQKIVEDVFKLSNKALTKARMEHCNETENNLRSAAISKTSDVLGIIEVIADYAQSVVSQAAFNLTSFCEKSESVREYQIARCPDGCYKPYYSTKMSKTYYSTKYRPAIIQSTWHVSGFSKRPYEQEMFRARDNENDTVNEAKTESKRELQADDAKIDLKSNNEDNVEPTAMKAVDRVKRDVDDPKRRTRAKRKKSRPVSKTEEDRRDETYSEEDQLMINERKNKKNKRLQSKSAEGDLDEKSVENKEIVPESDDNTKTTVKKLVGGGGKNKKYKWLQSKSAEGDLGQDSMSMENKENDPGSDDNTKTTVKKLVGGGGKNKKYKWLQSQSAEGDLGEDSVKEFVENKENDPGSDDNTKTTVQKLVGGEENKKNQWLQSKSAEGDVKDPVAVENEVNEPESDDGEGSLPKTVNLSKANQEFYDQRRWPQGVVRYVIDQNCTKFDVKDLRKRLGKVNAILRKRTCARIEELRWRAVNKHEDYLVLDNSADYVTGRVGDRQVFGSVELLQGGQHRQHTAMMVMAMLGFYFELARHDRDKYVKVHMRHIRPDKLHHFEKIGADATLPLPYDYRSATQPAWMFWRKIGRKGISTVATYKDKDPDGSIMKSFGQHKKLLSEGDIIKINSVYGTKCMKKDDKNPKKEY